MKNMRFVVSALIGIGIVIIIVVLIVRAFASLGNRGEESVSAGPVALTAQRATDSTMRLEVQGRLNNEEEHRRIVIAVDRQFVQLQVLGGYQNTVLESHTFPNNEAAYAEFLAAIDRVGFTKGTSKESVRSEEGFCPFGQRYIFSATGDDLDSRYWSSSCGRGVGNSTGNASSILRLFRAQVPEYNSLVSGVRL